MFRQHFKQAFQMLKENPLVSAISITGTALAIALIMVMIILFQIKVANYSPENRRDHCLFIATITSRMTEGERGYTNNSGVSYELMRDYIYEMRTPQLICAFTASETNLSIATKRLYSEYSVKATDTNYWKLFEFHFLQGGPFDQGEYDSGLPLAIISKEVAELLLGDNLVIGNTININLIPHKIVGVVDDVSKAATDAFAHVWVPITSNTKYMDSQSSGTMGNLMTCFLFKDKKNKAEIEAELESVMKRFSDNTPEYIVTARLVNYVNRVFGSYWNPKALPTYYVESILMILFLLLLPAINLTGITMNNIRQRTSEIGIRKAFGANKSTLLRQILMENLVITAIGAVIGFLLSFVFIHVGRSFLLSSDTLLTVEMLLSPFSFLAAVFFCLTMNLLSAGLPAWQMSQSTVIESLAKHES